jgi:hypothetical protein
MQLQALFAGREGQVAGVAIRRVVGAKPEQRMLNGMNARQHVMLRTSQRGQA